MSSFEIIENPGYTTTIVQEFTKISRQELEAKESEYIQKNNCVNKLKLFNDKEKIENRKQYDKNYYKNNKSKFT